MKVRILGAHTIASADTGFAGILIDDILALDAGSLVSSLSFEQQKKLKAIILTHSHYDHIRDIPAIGWSMTKMKTSLDIYTSPHVYGILLDYLNHSEVYQDYTQNPPENPALRIHPIEPGKKVNIAGYEVLPLSVMHAVPTVGLQVTSPEGKKVFYTSDTGLGLADVWRQVSPDVLLIELTLPNAQESYAHVTGHLTPASLQKELVSLKTIKGYLPRVVLVHLDPLIEDQLKKEITAVEKALKIKITFSHEGMDIRV
jgi:phosphoribosyl 1,2-cyclic phosphodiesterase